jgi:hypothetical protein
VLRAILAEGIDPWDVDTAGQSNSDGYKPFPGDGREELIVRLFGGTQWRRVLKRFTMSAATAVIVTTSALLISASPVSASGAALNNAASLAGLYPTGTHASTGWTTQSPLTARPRALGSLGDPAAWITTGPRSEPDGTIPTATSANWSGYIDSNYETDGHFRNIAATWNVPEIPDIECSSGDYGRQTGLFWVGLDGVSDDTVEQTGTASKCDNGVLSYYSWYQMYPSASVEIGSVNPGDQMSAYVEFTGKSYLLSIVDNSTGDYLSTLKSCPQGSSCLNDSAEAVAETPGGCTASASQVCRPGTRYYELPDFVDVHFSGISVATTRHGGTLATAKFGPQNVTMEDVSSSTLAQVTRLWHPDSFVDSWVAST